MRPQQETHPKKCSPIVATQSRLVQGMSKERIHFLPKWIPLNEAIMRLCGVFSISQIDEKEKKFFISS
jgi:hypothetical protein